MRKLLLLPIFLLFADAHAGNLVQLYSRKDAKLNGVYESYLDKDSVKEIKPGVFDIETIENIPPLMDSEGSVVESPYRSEKMYITIYCNTNRAKRKIIIDYFGLNAVGSIQSRLDLSKDNKGFVMSPKTSEFLSAKIVCKK